MEKVSIILPSYNSSKTILETIDSILNQTIQNFECIIIDDNSTDDSLEKIIEKVSSDKRFVIKKIKRNRGVVNARNLGIKESKGRFICFLDSDDLWSNDFLELSLNKRAYCQYALTHTNYLRFQKKTNQTIIKEIKPPKLICQKNILPKNHMPLLTVMIDRKIIGDFQFKECRPEDYFLWCEFIKNRGFQSILVDQTCAFYRVSNKQRSKNKAKSIIRLFNFFYIELNCNLLKSVFYLIFWAILNLIERFRPFRKINLTKYKIP